MNTEVESGSRERYEVGICRTFLRPEHRHLGQAISQESFVVADSEQPNYGSEARKDSE